MTIKKIPVIAMLMMLCATMVFAEFEEQSPSANGYDWIRYTNRQKHICAILITVVFGLDKVPHNPERMIRALDLFYNRAIKELKKDPKNTNAETALHFTCIEVIQLVMIRGVSEAGKARGHTASP